MGVLEIVLLAAGVVIFIVSFCIPVKQEKLHEETKRLAEGEVKALVSAEMDNIRPRLTELSEEEMQHQIEKSERSMERISNEKIMAVNEYSDTVLDEIHKNHEEVVFLYDMLKDKKEHLTESFGTAVKNIQGLLQQVRDSEITVEENLKKLEEKQKETASYLDGVSKKQESSKKDAMRSEAGVAAQGRKTSRTAGVTALDKEVSHTPEAMVSFVPFEPEKVEAVPKRKSTRRPPQKKEIENKEIEKKEKALVSDNKQEANPMIPNAAEGIVGKNSNERILELHKAGKSKMAIAKELGLGIGEVKLVIDLFESLR